MSDDGLFKIVIRVLTELSNNMKNSNYLSRDSDKDH